MSLPNVLHEDMVHVVASLKLKTPVDSKALKQYHSSDSIMIDAEGNGPGVTVRIVVGRCEKTLYLPTAALSKLKMLPYRED